jgi:hypothetical protein
VAPSTADAAAQPASQIYFTAVPAAQGLKGLFGYLNAVPAELTEGSVQ